MLLAIPLGAAAGMLSVGAASAIAHSFGAPPPDYSMFDPLKGNLGEYLFWAVAVTWGTAALGEELLFRGFLLNTMESLFGGPRPVATVSAILIQAFISAPCTSIKASAAPRQREPSVWCWALYGY